MTNQQLPIFTERQIVVLHGLEFEILKHRKVFCCLCEDVFQDSKFVRVIVKLENGRSQKTVAHKDWMRIPNESEKHEIVDWISVNQGLN